MSGVDLGYATESVVGLCPFTVRRVARWSECDPAGVVFTGNYPLYLLSAVGLLRRHLAGGDWGALARAEGIGTPAKAISLVFGAMILPEQPFDIAVTIERLGRTTTTFAARAQSLEGTPLFEGSLTSIIVPAEMPARTSCPIPDRIRALLEAYRDACAAPVPAA